MKYSVLMSVYIREKAAYLSAAFDSMLLQTVKPDEIVLIEDGPLNEDLYQCIKTYENNYPEIFNVIQNEQNLGLGRSLHKGILLCRNELIARMDSDDISRRDRIEKQLKCFEQDPMLSVCGGAIQEFVEDDTNDISGVRRCPESDEEIKEYLKKRCPLNHMTVMYKRSDVLKAGNYQHLLYNEDYLLWINMAKAGCKFHNVRDILVDARTDRDMYSNRRGGDNYYQSEKAIQDILLEEGMIDRFTYQMNLLKRFILQKAMTPGMRSLIFRHFAREKE